jgi:uncharacterized protein (DUF111 family)
MSDDLTEGYSPLTPTQAAGTGAAGAVPGPPPRTGRLAYFDCFAGISGDMTLGALIAAGVDEDELRRGLESLGLPGWELRTRRVRKHAITATDVEVIDQGTAPHDHDQGHEERDPGDADPGEQDPSHRHSYSYVHHHVNQHGQGHSHVSVTVSQAHAHATTEAQSHHDEQGHSQAHGHVHSQTDSPDPHGHLHAEPHDHVHGRRLSDILTLIRASGLPEPVKERASAVFQRLGEAEALVHAVPVESIHFHEVGAVDSIIDIVGSVLGLYLLGVERIVCSPLPTGHGFVWAAHGLMPLPAPATMELLKGIPTRPVDVEGELVTPTGAALMATLADAFGWMPAMRVETIGYGAGKKEFPFPNLLRVCVGVAG